MAPIASRPALFLAILLACGVTACRKPVVTLRTTPEPTTPEPVPTPPPAPYVPNKRLETGRLFNGIQYKVTLETEHGESATVERTVPSSYTVDLQVKVRVPKPHKELAEISRLNDKLPALLPQLGKLLETATVSPAYDTLYRLKVTNLQQSLNRLDNLLSRHNFFDCETILELQHPDTKRRALFMQADMDVDTDGSDSDRVPEIEPGSSTFQPFTSYKWAKKTENPSPFIAAREARLKAIEQELSGNGVSSARARELKETQTRIKGEIADLKKYSYLVAAADPFVVLPGSITGKKTPFSPVVGDYCVVIHDGTLYPTIVGDVGPSFKTGEGSLRLCRQLNPRADVNNRPVSELKVSYLVFPGSGEKPWQAPDLAKWHARCQELLAGMGGHEGELFVWDDLTKPKPPTPPATPSPPPVETKPAASSSAPADASPAPVEKAPAPAAKSSP